MDYELALKLKEAGYSFREVSHEDIISGLQKIETNKYIRIDDFGDWYWVVPTFNELVEACGEKFTSLYHLPPQDRNPLIRWCADYQINGTTQLCGDGKTPQEAVALLWLQLNKNANTKTEKTS